jgi:hypothetical protein
MASAAVNSKGWRRRMRRRRAACLRAMSYNKKRKNVFAKFLARVSAPFKLDDLCGLSPGPNRLGLR